jgi:hypothetical protein
VPRRRKRQARLVNRVEIERALAVLNSFKLMSRFLSERVLEV